MKTESRKLRVFWTSREEARKLVLTNIFEWTRYFRFVTFYEW